MPIKNESTTNNSGGSGGGGGGVISEYFEATRKYTQEYGPQTLVLMQVGAFYEVYGLKDAPQGTCSRIEDFCRLCELKLAEKSKERFEGVYTVYMAGFGEYNLEKYVKIMTDAGYHCVVFVQEDDMRRAGCKRRVFHAVYSSGTFLSLDDSSSLSNHTMVVWVHKFTSVIRKESKYLCGFAVVNILTGHSSLYEYTTQRLLSPTAFDELERAMASFTPSEIIFLHEDPHGQEADQILQFTGMNRCKTLHMVTESAEKAERLKKQTYIDTTLAFYLGEQASKVCQEFTTYEFATRCFVYLLDFLQSHNPHLVQKIQVPVFTNNSSRVILANHTLKQLQILGPQGVIHFLNRTNTAMGSRLFQTRLQNPISDTATLDRAYDDIEWALRLGEEKRAIMRKHLSKIRDLERIGRRLLFGKIYPAAVYECYRGIREWSAVILEAGPLPNDEDTTTDAEFQRVEFLDDLETKLDLAVCEGMNHFDFLDQPLFRTQGATSELTQTLKDLKNLEERLQIFARELNRLVNAEDWVKIHVTAKSGSSLQTTPTRAAHFKKLFTGTKPSFIQVQETEVSLDQFRVVSTGSSMTLESPHLHHTCKEILKNREKVAQLSAECYQAFLKEWETRWGGFLAKEAHRIAEMDVVLTKAHLAAKYRYCRPTLFEGEKASFSAKDLRHVLIEQLQTNEMYVANDLSLGDKGLLLFGTNAVGKTSLIKAAGIAVIMAQAGMFVPCSEFRLCPYRAVYSRILGNDDLFRGLSTFVVEMSELRVILKSADAFSLVLGDELCSGTEMESALSIFVAGLQHLVKQGASFVFATHFHEIVHYEEIENMTDTLSMKHLSVIYDREREMLVYDRKLREGSGEAIYGLEVAKSLFMPQEFLEAAFQLRAKYFPTTAKVSPLSCKVSRYNSRKIKTLCEICKKRMGEEVHHKVAQHLADKEGFLPGGFVPKNHKANLMSVCEDCHGKIHHQDKI